ncbi:MAG: Polysaccharide export protein [Cyanobacteria bacterium RYN_339]|nr:Polysaccharide export protein [Cyanobacteria bacterium RYN_339]
MPTLLPRLLTGLLTAASLALLAPAPAVAAEGAQPTSQNYVLRFGDTLNLRVLENDKLETKDLPVRPDGRISLPLVGEVQAAGLTVPQLQVAITKAYTKYYVDPHVVAYISHFRPLSISVIGLVNRPDTFKIEEPVRLLQAIGLAGGINHERGDIHHVLVVRAGGEHQDIDLQDVMEGKVADNIMLYDGDTVRVFEVSGPDWYRVLPVAASSASLLSSILVILLQIERTASGK